LGLGIPGFVDINAEFFLSTVTNPKQQLLEKMREKHAVSNICLQVSKHCVYNKLVYKKGGKKKKL